MSSFRTIPLDDDEEYVLFDRKDRRPYKFSDRTETERYAKRKQRRRFLKKSFNRVLVVCTTLLAAVSYTLL